MDKALKGKIINRLMNMDGKVSAYDGEAKVGFYFKNLVTGEEFGFNENEQFLPASIVKLPLLAVMMLLREKGETDFSEKITIKNEQKLPGCGVISHMTGNGNGDVTLDINTLYKFMIVISDTTATNGLYRHYGNDKIIDALKELGFVGTQFNRAYYDSVREEQGIQNYFVPKEIGIMLEKIYNRTLISEVASEEMERILLLQQVNHKLCGKLPIGFPVAHKTGEECDKTHDVGIVYGKEPFIVCFASFQYDIPEFEDFIRETTYEIARDIDDDLIPNITKKGFF